MHAVKPMHPVKMVPAAAKSDPGLQSWICSEVSRLLRTLRPWMNIAPEVVQGYALALQPACSEVEVTALINQAILRKWPNLNWPSPAELRDLLWEQRENRGPATRHGTALRNREASDDCKLCGGTGFEVIMRREARVAVRCRCRPPKQ